MHRLNILFLLLGVYLLSACSGNLSAKVFLDSNADNKHNENEPLIVGMPTTLYRDGNAVENLTTDVEGNVHFAVWQKGKYCVRLDQNQVSQMREDDPNNSQDDSKVLRSAKLLEEPESTPQATPKPDPTPTPAATTSAKEEENSTQTVTTVKGYEACAETKGLLNLSLEVPVPLEIGKTIASIPEPAPISVNAGDEVELSIVYPKSCQLKELTLPEAVGVPAAEGLLRSINNWDEIIAIGGKSVTNSKPSAVNRDGLRQFPLKLKVTGKILDLNPARLEITPQVTCPNGGVFNLKTHVLQTGGQALFEIFHDREGEAVPGGEVTIVTHVINRSGLNFPTEDVQLIFTPPLLGDISYDAECGSSHCSFALEPEQEKELRTKIKIPAALPQTTNFQLSAKLKVTVEGHAKVYAEEAPAQFSVLP